ncbi:hypothetical protein Hanom_Chr07g00610191 [Helianthus anomalus]
MMSSQFGDQVAPGKHGEGEVEVEQAPAVSVHEEEREVAREVGGEKSPTAVLVDTCMGGDMGFDEVVGTKVGHGRNFNDQANSPKGNSLYRFSSVGPSKIRRRPRSSQSHKPKSRVQASPNCSAEPRPKKRGRTEDGDPFDIDRFIGNLVYPSGLERSVTEGAQGEGLVEDGNPLDLNSAPPQDASVGAVGSPEDPEQNQESPW